MKPSLRAYIALFSSVVSCHLCASQDFHSQIEIGQGYRHDHLKFSIAGRHNKPNIISELDFKNIQVYLTTLKATLSNGCYIGVVDLAYGDVIHGKVRDSDYFKDNRHGEFSRSRSKVSGNYTLDASAKIGRIFPFSSGFSFTPSIGYGAFWQHLRMKDGRQILPNHHHIDNLHSTYKTCWSAPFVDLRFSIPLCSRLSLGLGYMFFYPIKYTGKGEWNLRHLHFTQKNQVWKSYGQRGDICLRWAFAERFELGLSAALAQFTAKDGTVHLKQNKFKGHQPSHRARRTFGDYVLTLSYAF